MLPGRGRYRGQGGRDNFRRWPFLFLCLVVPTLKITTKPSAMQIRVHQRVNLTCHVNHFYPSRLHLIWMENRHKVQTVESPQVTRNPDGTYSLEHTWQVEATLDGREFACWVVQDEQPPVQANTTLRAQASRLWKGGCSLLPAPLGSLAGKARCENTCHLPGVQTAVGQGLKAARDEGEGREDALGL